MPGGDLDDFELERTPHTPRDEPERTLAAEAPFESELSTLAADPEGGGRLFLPTLVALALVALGVLVLLFVVFRQPVKPKPAEAAAAAETAPARPVASAAAPVAAAPLPGLDESDDYVRRAAASLSSRPELARWLAQPALVRTLVAVVTNVADGETPRPHLGFLAPAQHFRAKGAPGRHTVADPASFTGYDRFADAIASIDASAAVSSLPHARAAVRRRLPRARPPRGRLPARARPRARGPARGARPAGERRAGAARGRLPLRGPEAGGTHGSPEAVPADRAAQRAARPGEAARAAGRARQPRLCSSAGRISTAGQPGPMTL